VDIGYLDPAECYYVYGQPPPSAQGHSGYWADPRVWTVINRVAAGLAPVPGAKISPQLVQEIVEGQEASPAG
jgi:hypothetical protein